MASKQSKTFRLTIPEALYKKIEEEKNKNAYINIQEVITQKLREQYYQKTDNKLQTTTSKKKSNAGRPKQPSWESIMHRKKPIFGKSGVAPKF